MQKAVKVTCTPSQVVLHPVVSERVSCVCQTLQPLRREEKSTRGRQKRRHGAAVIIVVVVVVVVVVLVVPSLLGRAVKGGDYEGHLLSPARQRSPLNFPHVGFAQTEILL